MKILLVAASFNPEYGGPAFSVSQLAVALAEQGVQIGVWSVDRSAVTTQLIPGNSRIRRLVGTEADALTDFGDVDIIHDNGIWRPHNHKFAELARTRRIRRMVSIRGMLEPWAVNHKAWKKKMGWWLYQKRDLSSAHSHHATSDTEAQHIRDFRVGVPIFVIPNGVHLPLSCPDVQVRSTKRTALYLGRLHPKKGLTLLIEAWARVRPQEWQLQISGFDEMGYRSHLERAVTDFGLGGEVSFTGAIVGEQKESAFLSSELFVFPTYSENFGMVVAEALAHGLPVLTTTGAPWRMLSERACGWSVGVSVEEIGEGLRQATGCDSNTLRKMGANGRDWVQTEFAWKGIAQKFIDAYDQLLIGHDYAKAVN